MRLGEIENLFINNEAYLRLSSLLNPFNPIKVMGMERMEIRHSAILAWLIDPSENHNMGDSVLRAFISESLKGQENTAINALDVLTSNLSNAIVYREWKNIDILIVEPDLRWIFLVENKIDSSQHGDQLERYIKTVKANENLLMGASIAEGSNKSPPHIQGVYLTLDDEDPKNRNYVPITHRAISEILIPITQSHSKRLANPVFNFIHYYIEVLKEMNSEAEKDIELETLAKKLYKENRRVIDYIVEHGSQTALDLALAEFSKGDHIEPRDALVIRKNRLSVERLGKRYVSLIPETWATSLGGFDLADPEHNDYPWKGCENWRLPFPVGIWVEISETNKQIPYEICITAEVGPLASSDLRRKLIQILTNSLRNSNAERSGSKRWFRAGAEKDGAKYSRFFVAKKGVKEPDNIPELKEAIENAWKSFEQIIDPVSSGLREFISVAPPRDGIPNQVDTQRM